MKFDFKKEKLSFIDCIGYLLAKKFNAKLRTHVERIYVQDNGLEGPTKKATLTFRLEE